MRQRRSQEDVCGLPALPTGHSTPELGQGLTDRGREVMPPEPIPPLLGEMDVLKALH